MARRKRDTSHDSGSEHSPERRQLPALPPVSPHTPVGQRIVSRVEATPIPINEVRRRRAADNRAERMLNDPFYSNADLPLSPIFYQGLFAASSRGSNFGAGDATMPAVSVDGVLADEYRDAVANPLPVLMPYRGGVVSTVLDLEDGEPNRGSTNRR